MSLIIKNQKIDTWANQTIEFMDQSQTIVVQKHLDQLRQHDEGSLAERLMKIGQDTAPRFKEPLRSTEIGDLLYDEHRLPA